MTKTIPFFLFLLLIVAAKPAWAETSVNVSNSSSGNCNSHIKITTNGVTKEISTTDCKDISLSSDDSNPSSTSQPTTSPTSHPTSKPTYNPTSQPTIEPTDSASPSAFPTATPSAEPFPTPEQKTGFEKFFEQVIGLVFNIFDGK